LVRTLRLQDGRSSLCPHSRGRAGLRPDGQLIFLTNGVLAMLTIPDEENGAATDRLLRPYFGMHRFEWSDDDSVGFHLPHGEMLALLRQSGFVVEQLLESVRRRSGLR
jgi:hypothetical protein